MNPISSTFNAMLCVMLAPTFVKMMAWCDNEWGFSFRVDVDVRPQL